MAFLPRGGSSFGQRIARPDQETLNSSNQAWTSGLDRSNGLHDGQPGAQDMTDFDFLPAPRVVESAAWPTYSTDEQQPWSVWSAATNSHPAESSVMSVPMQRKLTGDTSALSDEMSVLSRGINTSLYSQTFQKSGNNTLPVGVESPVFSRTQARAGPVSRTKHATSKTQSPKASSRARGRPFPCQQCDMVLTCKSDLVKHTRWHDKPFTCDIRGCDRTKGFITQNDLDRHKKCRHFQGVYGKTRSFRCAGNGCKKPTKTWPRLDNFKSHVTKMHPEEDVEDVVKRSEIAAPQYPASTHAASSINVATTGVLPGIEDGDTPSSISHVPTHEAHSDSAPAPQSRKDHGEIPEHSQSQLRPIDGLEALSSAAGMIASVSSNKRPANTNAATPDPFSTLVSAFMTYVQHDQVAGALPNNTIPSIHPDTIPSPRSPICQPLATSSASIDVQPPVRKALVIQTIEAMLSNLKQSIPSAPQKPSSPKANQNNGPEGGYHCEECGKYLKRNCDKNKHMKRHTKPYGCTFTNCDKVFGSKNDWKRHENSQHFQGEFFKCQQTSQGERFDKCPFMTQHQSDMELHLNQVHSLSIDAAKGQVAMSHVGRNHQSRFWCGFCGIVVRLDTMGVAAWDERFNHIDKHFMKDGRRIDEWVDPVSHKTKRELQATEDERRRTRAGNAAAAAAHTGPTAAAASTKRAAGESPEQDETRWKQQKLAGASIIITCCGCRGIQLSDNSPVKCTTCTHEWCSLCPKEVTK